MKIENVNLKIEALKSIVDKTDDTTSDILFELLLDLENIKREELGWQLIGMSKNGKKR